MFLWQQSEHTAQKRNHKRTCCRVSYVSCVTMLISIILYYLTLNAPSRRLVTQCKDLPRQFVWSAKTCTDIVVIFAGYLYI
jgi:hypothetical protein